MTRLRKHATSPTRFSRASHRAGSRNWLNSPSLATRRTALGTRPGQRRPCQPVLLVTLWRKSKRSADGSRQVLSKELLDALKEHRLALPHCLERNAAGRGSCSVAWTARQGIRARRVRHRPQCPLSTVELRPQRPQFDGQPSPRLVQRRSTHSRPTPACRAAVRRCRTHFERPPPVRHLDALLRGAPSGLERRHAEEAKLREEALRRAIGKVR